MSFDMGPAPLAERLLESRVIELSAELASAKSRIGELEQERDGEHEKLVEMQKKWAFAVRMASDSEARLQAVTQDNRNPHPSGPAHGCPYDYSNPETERILREERGSPMPCVEGTFNCPICGSGTPHGHTELEITKSHNRNLQAQLGAVTQERDAAILVRFAEERNNIQLQARNKELEDMLRQSRLALTSQRTVGLIDAVLAPPTEAK